MAREISVPKSIVREEIRGLEEWPAHGVTPGAIKVLVGRVDDAGNFIVPQTFETYHIEGEMYEQLVAAEPPSWAPDKPPGTYRNEDLWHFIDQVRAGMTAEPEEEGESA